MTKKHFPKITKKIKSFLTNESGKITKKDAFGLSIGAVLLTSADDALGLAGGGGGHSSYGHTNSLSCSSTSHSNNFGHNSGIVNGHYSSPTSHSNTSGTNVKVGAGSAYGHSSHGSHGSHGSRR